MSTMLDIRVGRRQSELLTQWIRNRGNKFDYVRMSHDTFYFKAESKEALEADLLEWADSRKFSADRRSLEGLVERIKKLK